MKAHAQQITKVAALCACLGLGLYVLAETIASSGDPNRNVLWLALALSGGLSLISGFHFVGIWRSGEMYERTGRLRRTDEPVAYWALMALHGAALVALAALAAYCATRLIAQ